MSPSSLTAFYTACVVQRIESPGQRQERLVHLEEARLRQTGEPVTPEQLGFHFRR
jgi:hypothetical protein